MTGRLGTAGRSEDSTLCPCRRMGRQGTWAVEWCQVSAVCCLVLLWCCHGGWAACKATMWWALQWWCWVSVVCCLVLLWCCRGGWAACKATRWWALQWCCRGGWAACKATRWWALQWWCWVSLVCCLGLLWCCRGGWAACRATMWWALQWWCQRGALQRQQGGTGQVETEYHAKKCCARQLTTQRHQQVEQADQPLRDFTMNTAGSSWHKDVLLEQNGLICRQRKATMQSTPPTWSGSWSGAAGPADWAQLAAVRVPLFALVAAGANRARGWWSGAGCLRCAAWCCCGAAVGVGRHVGGPCGGRCKAHTHISTPLRRDSSLTVPNNSERQCAVQGGLLPA